VSERNFFAELKRRNVYKVAVAYAVVAWLLIQIATQVFPFFEVPNWVVRLVVLLLLIGFPVALILAWAFELTPEGIKRTDEVSPEQSNRGRTGKTLNVAIITTLVLVIGLLIFDRIRQRSVPAPAAEKSVAVLPFVDLSQAKDQEYFCDGISEELLDALSRIEGLRVVARTSSFSFKGKNTDAVEIAQKLNVQNVLEGSLRRDGNRIRITAQLLSRDGFHIWSDTFERELQGVFAVQDEITRAITDALKLKLIGPTSSRRQGRNTEAYDLYLQGVFFSNKSTEDGLRKSLEFFQRSLEKDPNSARAWAGIAKDWEWLADAYVKPLEAYPAMKAAALKAISLDEREPEGHVYLGDARRVLDWDIAADEAEQQRAIELDPNCAAAHLLLALGQISLGKIPLAELHRRAAVKGDPLSPIVSNFSAVVLLSAGQTDEAIAEAKRTLELDPNYFYENSVLAEAYRVKGMFSEAIELFKKAEQVSGLPQSGLAVTYAEMGRQDEARQILDNLKSFAATKYFPAEEIAAIYVALGENDQAFEWLDRACQEHSGSVHSISMGPSFRKLHSDPRFPALLKRIGLDPAPILARDKAP
jgi:serine/threonine-protein kinase